MRISTQRAVSWALYPTVDMLSQGEYAKALPLYARALEIWEAALGPDHLYVASGLNNMAMLLEAQVRIVSSFSSMTRISVIFQYLYGDGRWWHLVSCCFGSGTATPCARLRCVHIVLGEDREGTRWNENAPSEIFWQPTGGRHAWYADVTCVTCRFPLQEKYDEALPLYERSLSIRKGVLGSNHPDVANSLNNLAELLREQVRFG